MVIQRWQSVMLLIAAMLMGAYISLPTAYAGTDCVAVHTWDNTVYFIVNILIGVLLLLDIFLYKNLKLQMQVAAAALVLIAVSLGLACTLVFQPEYAFSCFGIPFLAVAMVMTWFARRMMNKDRRLLAAADRLR